MAKYRRIVLGGQLHETGRSIVVEARGVVRYGRLQTKRYRNPISGEFPDIQFYIDKLLMLGGNTFRMGTHRAKWVR